MTRTKQEFIRVRKEIHTEGLASTIFYRRKTRFMGVKDAAAYVSLDPYKCTVVLNKGRNTYEDLIVLLGHEYGHVVDYSRKPTNLRWQDYTSMPEDLMLRSKRPVRQKIALLRTEAIAEGYIPTFIKKFNISISKSAEELYARRFYYLISMKYNLMYGKPSPRKLEDQWYHLALNKAPSLDPKWLYNFKKLLK